MIVYRGYLIPWCKERDNGKLEKILVEILNTEEIENRIKFILKDLSKNLDPISLLADKLSERIMSEEGLIKAPADTRYPLFLSSLGCHLLTTSALVFCLAKEAKVENEKIQLLRIVALTHDLGKLRGIKKHEESSIRLLEETGFLRILGNNALLVKDLILCHEQDLWEKEYKGATEARKKRLQELKPLCEIIWRADRFSARTDRLSKYFGEVKHVLSEGVDFEKQRKELEKRLEEARKKVCKMIPKPYFPAEGSISLACIDVRNVQTFITQGGRLHDLRGGSTTIEEVLEEARKAMKEIPPEAFLVKGGGRLIFISPSSSVDDVIEFSRKRFEQRGLKVSSCYIQFNPEKKIEFSMLWHAISNKLIAVKYSERYKRGILWGHVKRCKACGENPAKEEDGEELCSMCREKREMGKEEFQGKLLKALPDLQQEIQLLLNNLPEFIAGATVDLIRQQKQPVPNIAILRGDGNMVGKLFMECLSFTQLLELCYRLNRFCNRVKRRTRELFDNTAGLKGNEKIDDHDGWRFLIGEIFTAADDLLWILPSWASPLVALVCAREFYIELGGEASLAIGVVSMHPKSPISLGLNLADKLMKNAKEIHRQDLRTGARAAGYMDFEICFREVPSRETFELGRKAYERWLSRPIRLSEGSIGLQSSDHEIDVFKMICMILNTELKIYDENLFRRGKELILLKKKELKEIIRRMRDVTLFFKPEEENAEAKALTYTMYQRTRSVDGEKAMKIYDKIFDLLMERLDSKPKLLDTYVLSRILEGGFE
jgi:hypothetical protein